MAEIVPPEFPKGKGSWQAVVTLIAVIVGILSAFGVRFDTVLGASATQLKDEEEVRQLEQKVVDLNTALKGCSTKDDLENVQKYRLDPMERRITGLEQRAR
jgi:hypothetical protein